VKTFITYHSLKEIKMRRSFRKTLEDKANELAAQQNLPQWDTSLTAMLRREIALTMDQLDQLKFLKQDQHLRLLRLECDINTQIKRHRQQMPWYVPHHLPQEQKLRQQLLDIGKEKRNLTIRLHDKKHTLEDRLLELINKHEHIDN